uniref:ZP domain-containing protein n=1 Tax=Leptobrachium leishanense TaxID=445787 RepID=A0A8C5MXJ7_9ANUR
LCRSCRDTLAYPTCLLSLVRRCAHLRFARGVNPTHVMRCVHTTGSTEAGLSDLHCDSNKYGWYRFEGSGGIRMPETCKPIFSCGTHAPLWLNGLHPKLNEGIVNHTACAHWAGDCCKWSKDVQIKLCPGGYHVYKFSGTPLCEMTYCTDPRGLFSFMKCKPPTNDYFLYFLFEEVADIHTKLTCGKLDMRATFQKCQFNDLNIKTIHLTNSSCFNVLEDIPTNTYVIVSPLRSNTCGTQLIKNSTHANYKSTLHIELEPDSIITRLDELNIFMSCVYKLDLIASLNTALRPIIGSVNISLGGTGQFTAYMALYKDSGYTQLYEGSQVDISVKSILYIGVFIDDGGPSHYVLVLRNCYATPTENPEHTVKYYIIKDSCANTQDSTITVKENGVSMKALFSVQMFKFVGDYDRVYLHCQMSLCDAMDSSCTPVIKHYNLRLCFGADCRRRAAALLGMI